MMSDHKSLVLARSQVNYCFLLQGHTTMESSSVIVQRRMYFASLFLPADLPHYWDIIARFRSKRSTVTPEAAKLTVENTKIIDPEAFISDAELTEKILQIECSATKQPLGIPLIPSQTYCTTCNGKLLLRGDRPSRLNMYN